MPGLGTSKTQKTGELILRLLLSDHFVLLLSLTYFLVLCIFFPGMVGSRNLSNLSSNMWPLLTLVIGQMFVLIVGGIDLSQTSVMAVTSVLGAMVMSNKLDPMLFENNALWGIVLSEQGGWLGGVSWPFLWEFSSCSWQVP